MALSDTEIITDWREFRNTLLAADAVTELVSGVNMTVCRYTINTKMKVASHSHAHEQISLVLKGEVLLTVGDKVIKMKAGDVQVIPAHVKHASEIIGTPFQTVESFCPVRSDFIDKLQTDRRN